MIKESPKARILYPGASDQAYVLETVKKYAQKGGYEGIQSPYIRTSDLSTLQAKANSLSKQAASSMSAYDVGQAMYAEAAFRDAKYSYAGRKFMRSSGLNSKVVAAFGRIAVSAMNKDE